MRKYAIILSVLLLGSIFGLLEFFEDADAYGSGKKPDPRVCGDKLCSEIPGGREAWESEDETLEENMDKLGIAIISSPLKQVKNGIAPEDVICKEGMQLIFKSVDSSPACVKPETKEKLLQRGWAKTLDKVSEVSNNPRDIEVMARGQNP